MILVHQDHGYNNTSITSLADQPPMLDKPVFLNVSCLLSFSIALQITEKNSTREDRDNALPLKSHVHLDCASLRDL